MNHIIAFTNQKGGVGKTTSCINTAAALAHIGKRVLLVDMDPQGNATTGSGLAKASLSYNVYHCLIDTMKASQVVLRTDYGYDILPSNRDLSGAEIELASFEGRTKRLKTILASLENIYDYVLIDCPPSLSLLTINSLCASQYIVIPMQCEFYALEGLSDLVNTIRRVRESLNPQLAILGVLMTMYDPRSLLTVHVSQHLSQHYGNKVFRAVIPRNVRLAEAPSHGKPAISYDPKSRGSMAYFDLAHEIIERFHHMETKTS